MPAFSLIDFLDYVLAQMNAHPIYAWLFCGTCIGLSVYMALRSDVKVTQKRDKQQNAEIALSVAQGQPTAKTRKVKAIVQMSDYRERKGA